MSGRKNDKEELYRRLEQARRHVSSASDPVTKERMTALVNDLLQQLAAAEAKDADAPPEL
ncbi:hypothetical protein [Tardiphaga sp.]|uniref:hypothetical protein n=1 Tax=Tardiphaga sp. TaxID=1926292 RepID=UPI002638884F|nr:hypothetical protein [Tardiphaga sp.]MDB5621152.1 hypothetical protein [Tardiphaga sp.]